MPVTKTAVRAERQSKRRRIINLKVKNAYKKAVKAVRDAVKKKKLGEAKKALPQAFHQLDFAAKKGVIHKNKASRLKSRLAKLIKK